MYTIPSVGPATMFVVSFESMLSDTQNVVLVSQIAIMQLESAPSEKVIPEVRVHFGSPSIASLVAEDPTAQRTG